MTAILLLLSILPSPAAPVCDAVAVTEVNNFYDGEGRLVLSQVVFWDERDNVIAWRMADKAGIRPQRDWSKGDYVSRWMDKDERFREVRAPAIRETFTQVDVEVLDREKLPVSMRRELSKR